MKNAAIPEIIAGKTVIKAEIAPQASLPLIRALCLRQILLSLL